MCHRETTLEKCAVVATTLRSTGLHTVPNNAFQTMCRRERTLEKCAVVATTLRSICLHTAPNKSFPVRETWKSGASSLYVKKLLFVYFPYECQNGENIVLSSNREHMPG
ncbi:hypothetical protein M8J77_000232 [Diaphorina citri]|nr:hypothetical protein M8J77_000232 [Diaphorina citri]